jgi:hypothetical protein
MLAQMQAQAEMQDFGNRLRQAGSWLQSINPSILPRRPSRRPWTAATCAARLSLPITYFWKPTAPPSL